MKFLESIRKEIRPTSHIAEVDETVAKINKALKSANLKADCVKGGSVAKGTFIRNQHDVDLFVRFDLSYKSEQISDILEKALKRAALENNSIIKVIKVKTGPNTYTEAFAIKLTPEMLLPHKTHRKDGGMVYTPEIIDIFEAA